MRLEAWSPLGDLVTLAVTTTTGRVELTQHPSAGGGSILVANDGGETAFVTFGDSTVEATETNGVAVLKGKSRLFGINPAITHAAAITAANTANVHFVPGRGN